MAQLLPELIDWCHEKGVPGSFTFDSDYLSECRWDNIAAVTKRCVTFR